MLRGDWGYVIAGYGLTGLVVGAYVARLFARASAARQRVERLRNGGR
jgi:CcmD family protein